MPQTAPDPSPESAAKALLIFPAGYGDGPERRAQAEALGVTVVGASSLADDPQRPLYERWVRLPHVTDPGFGPALQAAIAEHRIGRIHASHFAAWSWLEAALPDLAPGVALTAGRGLPDIAADYAALRARMAAAAPIPELAAASPPRPAPGEAEAAGWVRAAMSIPGESYEPKLLALVEACRRAPPGDVVEIGCLFGRTAALLAMLAERYALGSVLCVDPWSLASTEQGNPQLKAASQGFDWPAFRRVFEVNVAPFARGRLNYIHAPSTEGAAVYASGAPVVTEAFGETRYEGRIGLLHIDGNHAREHVEADVRDWVSHVKPGGWVVFDDYDWDWGDGPRVVADAWVARSGAGVRTRFTAGGALFVQLADAPA